MWDSPPFRVNRDRTKRWHEIEGSPRTKPTPTNAKATARLSHFGGLFIDFAGCEKQDEGGATYLGGNDIKLKFLPIIVRLFKSVYLLDFMSVCVSVCG